MTTLVTVVGEEPMVSVGVGVVTPPAIVFDGKALLGYEFSLSATSIPMRCLKQKLTVFCGLAAVVVGAELTVGAAPAKLVQNPSSELASLAIVTSMVAY